MLAGETYVSESGNTYEIVEAIGRGSYCSVFRATLRGEEVALKLIRGGGENTHERQMLDRIQERGTIGTKNDQYMVNAHFVRHIETGLATRVRSPEQYNFSALEFVAGPSLNWLIPLQVADYDTKRGLAQHVAAQMLAALCILQQAHIVHRDIKPNNIMITGHGTCKLIDFGNALNVGTPITDTAGSTPYMAPELCHDNGRNVHDIRSDIWALGIVFFEMIEGTTPLERYRKSGFRLPKMYPDTLYVSMTNPPPGTPEAAGIKELGFGTIPPISVQFSSPGVHPEDQGFVNVMCAFHQNERPWPLGALHCPYLKIEPHHTRTYNAVMQSLAQDVVASDLYQTFNNGLREEELDAPPE